MVAEISCIYYIIRVYANTNGEVQFSMLPKLSQELSLSSEYLDSFALTFNHIYIPSTVKSYIPGFVELSIITTTASKTTRKCQVGIQV